MTNSIINRKGTVMLEELQKDPKAFSEEGKPYHLLQLYFKGLDKKTLVPLLRSENDYVVSAATFICSELGREALELIDDVVPLLKNNNAEIRYDVLEVVMVCSVLKNHENFIYIIKALHDEIQDVRILAMSLISNCDKEQIVASASVVNQFLNVNVEEHVRGLEYLLNIENYDRQEIIGLLGNESFILRKYGAIMARMLFSSDPELIKGALNSNDLEIKKFAQDTVFILDEEIDF
jgi:hypothetical protein